MADETASAATTPMLSDLSRGRDNNLNLIRMIAASAVIVSHSFPIAYGQGTAEPLEGLIGHSLGWLAVVIFFIISGFLISKSFDQKHSGVHWGMARVMRIFPGLLVVLLITLLLLGPVLTIDPARQYWSAPRTWAYVPRNLSLVFMQYDLPGVFGRNPYPQAINGSLWTLGYEVACYVGVFVAGTIGILHRRYRLVFLILAVLLALPSIGYARPHAHPPSHLGQLGELAFPFALGTLAYVWRDRIKLDWKIAAASWVAAILLAYTPLCIVAFVIACACSVMILAYRVKGPILHYNRLGDYSYGTYIYAFPVQQIAVLLAPGDGWLVNLAISFPLTLACAILSWHFVEQPAQSKARPLADWIARARSKLPPRTADQG